MKARIKAVNSPTVDRIGCVLDVEIALDPDVFSLVADKSKGGFGRLPLKKLICATVLTFAEGDDAAFNVLGLQTFHAGKLPETAILAAVDAAVTDPLDPRSVLVTYNGHAHDLPLLRMRAMKSWAFDLDRLRGWDGASHRHVDVMLGMGGGARRLVSLEDVTALLGAGIRGRRKVSNNIAASHRAGDWDAIVRKNQLDVAATFMAYAHMRAWERGSSIPATSAWTAFSEFARRLPKAASHLAEFSHNSMVAVARQVAARPVAIAA